MKYSYLACTNVNDCINKFTFLKTSKKINSKAIVKTVNEFMNLCALELQQNNVIAIHGYYTKKSHVTFHPIDNTKIYSERPMTVMVGWKTLRDKFKRIFGKDVEISHKKHCLYIIVQNTNIGSSLLKDI